MSNLHYLVPELRDKAFKLIEKCKERNVNIYIYDTFRTLEQQAKLFKKSRYKNIILNLSEKLRFNGYEFLALELIKTLEIRGKYGDHITFSLPGDSWHNYKKAFDAVPIDEKRNPIWNTKHHSWKIYGECALELDLNWGGSWKIEKPDYPHCQLQNIDEEEKPLKLYSPETCYENIKKCYNSVGVYFNIKKQITYNNYTRHFFDFAIGEKICQF